MSAKSDLKMNKKLLTIVAVLMILLSANIVFSNGQQTWSAENRFTTDNGETWTSTRPSGNYYEVTGSPGNWQATRYQNNKPVEVFRDTNEDNIPPTTKLTSWQRIATRLAAEDINGDRDTNDPGEAEGLYYYAEPQYYLGGYYDSNNNYFSDNRAHLGTGFDSNTLTYIPTNNKNIRVRTYGEVYIDRNRDGKVDIKDIDLDGNGQVDENERLDASVSNTYNSENGWFSYKHSRDVWIDSNGNVYMDKKPKKETLGINAIFYKDGSFSYEEERLGINPRHMVLPNGEIVVNVQPDGEGGYYIDTDKFAGQKIKDYTVPAGEEYIVPAGETNIHYIATGDSATPYLAVINGFTRDIVFDPISYLGFTIDSDVTVSYRDDNGNLVTRTIVRDPQGKLYSIEGNKGLVGLILGQGTPLTPEQEREIFGAGGYRIYYLGVVLDDFKGVIQGYPGFSIFYSNDYYNDWTGLLQNEFVRTLFGGKDVWGNAICQSDVADTVGSNNVASGSDIGSAAAYISAEEYQRQNPNNPTQTEYLYMLEFYVYSGKTPEGYPTVGCTELDFQVQKQGASLFKDNVTGLPFTWELKEGETISYVGQNMWLGVASKSHIGEKVCIKFTKMVPNGCILGYGEGDSLCDTISLAAAETYDYDCEGFYCDVFLSQEGWSFTPQRGSTQTTSPVPVATTTDPVTRQPVLSFD